MNSPLNLGQDVSIQKIKRPQASRFLPKGFFTVEIHDKDGLLKDRMIVPNGITDGGKDHALGATFDAASQITQWYIGMIDNAGFSALADGDTMASHAGWTEFTAYSEGTRPEWDPDAPSGQAITNGTARDFNMSGAGTLYGLFITSDNVKGGSGGTLWATAAFASTVPVSASDLIKITYTITT